MNRFYAQHTTLSPLFASKWQTGWQVFDRNAMLNTNGELPPIAFCVSLTSANMMRDALEATATILSQERASHRPNCIAWNGCAKVGKCQSIITICRPLNNKGT